MGNTNITTDGDVRYPNVPIIVYLLNGNSINMTPDPIKTENHFKGLPIFGIVSSIKN